MITKEQYESIEVGDRIEFKAATRWNCGKVTRVVNGFWDEFSTTIEGKRPTVRYGGWGDFVTT